MSTKIGGLDSTPVQVGRGGGAKRTEGTPDGTQPAKSQSSSDTQITESARQLAALEQSVRDLPAVDKARVEQVRNSIQDGSYEVDAEKVADKLLQFEQVLKKDA